MSLNFLSEPHDLPAEQALELCHAKEVHHLPLFDGEELIGIVSDRDLRRYIGRGQLEGTPVAELASEELVTVAPQAPL